MRTEMKDRLVMVMLDAFEARNKATQRILMTNNNCTLDSKDDLFELINKFLVKQKALYYYSL